MRRTMCGEGKAAPPGTVPSQKNHVGWSDMCVSLTAIQFRHSAASVSVPWL